MRMTSFGDFLAFLMLATSLAFSAYSAWWIGQPTVAALALLAGTILLIWRFNPLRKSIGYLSRWRPRPRRQSSLPKPACSQASRSPNEPDSGSPASDEQPAAGSPSDRLVAEMIRNGREVLLLRPQIAANLDPRQLERAQARLDEVMAIVPQGPVLLQPWNVDRETAEPTSDEVIEVEGYYLDRFPVTNRQFKAFVDADGYEQMSFWDEEIWPAVLEFVDQTGHPGPRFWKDGSYASGTADHPVVGVSWYEASAYARWVGKRLPTDPEWVKAGAWPVSRDGANPVQRRFPWGDSMDRTKAHLWAPDVAGTVPVDATPGGQSVGGIHQLIGNVWEWTASPFAAWDHAARFLHEKPLKSVRGGAFDTYFDCQASCQFQSGEDPLARKHNIGFRCAVGVCDVEPVGWDRPEETNASHTDSPQTNPASESALS